MADEQPDKQPEADAPMAGGAGADAAPPPPPVKKVLVVGKITFVLNDEGFAIDRSGQRLALQPAPVFVAWYKLKDRRELQLWQRYEETGMFQLLEWDEGSESSPQFFCNSCQRPYALSAKMVGKRGEERKLVIEYSALGRHLRDQHPDYLLQEDLPKDPFAQAAAIAAQKRAREEGGAAVTAAPTERAERLTVSDVKDLIVSQVALMQIADGGPANIIAHVGLRNLLLNFGQALNPVRTVELQLMRLHAP